MSFVTRSFLVELFTTVSAIVISRSSFVGAFTITVYGVLPVVSEPYANASMFISSMSVNDSLLCTFCTWKYPKVQTAIAAMIVTFFLIVVNFILCLKVSYKSFDINDV